MAENLNFEAKGSKCYDNSEANCAIYGRLYNWATAMALDASCNSSSCASKVSAKHRGICSSGWHIPSDAEWTELTNFVGGSSSAGKYLKATNGWNSGGNGNNKYGFSALPGGYGLAIGGFSSVGYNGRWWSSSEGNANYTYSRNMYYYYEDVIYGNYDKHYFRSVRCLQD